MPTDATKRMDFPFLGRQNSCLGAKASYGCFTAKRAKLIDFSDKKFFIVKEQLNEQNDGACAAFEDIQDEIGVQHT